MPKVKDLVSIRDKWKRRTENAGEEYKLGVQNPSKDWATETTKAENAYEAGIRASLALKSFGKGVKQAGTAAWQKGAIEKGPERFAQGVAYAEDKYAKGFDPYRTVIEQTNLPDRGRRGDPKNMQRSINMAKALHDKKVQLKGGV